MTATRTTITGATLVVVLVGGCFEDQLSNPTKSTKLTGQAEIDLIDQMRAKGSAQDAHDHLTATAAGIAEHIAATIPGQTWEFTDDPQAQIADRRGGPCEELTANIAVRPKADTVIFGRGFPPPSFPSPSTACNATPSPTGPPTPRGHPMTPPGVMSPCTATDTSSD